MDEIELNKLEAELEKKELDEWDALSAIEYEKLLMIYFYKKDYINIKFLLKRLPVNVKGCPEIKLCMDAYKSFKDVMLGTALHILADNKWCDEISPLVKLVHSSWYQFAIRTIAKVYSSVKVEDLAKMGFNYKELMKICEEYSWKVEGNFIYPLKDKYEKQEEDKVDDYISGSSLSNLVDVSVHLEQS